MSEIVKDLHSTQDKSTDQEANLTKDAQKIPPILKKPKRRLVKLSKALQTFFDKDFENWMTAYLGTNPSASKQHDFKMTIRYQRDAMHNARVLLSILKGQTPKIDDSSIRDWAVGAGAGMGPPNEPMYTTYELLGGPMRYIDFAITDTANLGMGGWRGKEKLVRGEEEAFVMACWADVDRQLKKRFDVRGSWS